MESQALDWRRGQAVGMGARSRRGATRRAPREPWGVSEEFRARENAQIHASQVSQGSGATCQQPGHVLHVRHSTANATCETPGGAREPGE